MQLCPGGILNPKLRESLETNQFWHMCLLNSEGESFFGVMVQMMTNQLGNELTPWHIRTKRAPHIHFLLPSLKTRSCRLERVLAASQELHIQTDICFPVRGWFDLGRCRMMKCDISMNVLHWLLHNTNHEPYNIKCAVSSFPIIFASACTPLH